MSFTDEELKKIATEGDFSWVKIKRHREDESASWKDRHAALEAHHIKETERLVSVCRELANHVIILREIARAAMRDAHATE